jgi:hypothetical protein
MKTTPTTSPMEMATISPLLKHLFLVTISIDGLVCGGPVLSRLGMVEVGGVECQGTVVVV